MDMVDDVVQSFERSSEAASQTRCGIASQESHKGISQAETTKSEAAPCLGESISGCQTGI